MLCGESHGSLFGIVSFPVPVVVVVVLLIIIISVDTAARPVVPLVAALVVVLEHARSELVHEAVGRSHLLLVQTPAPSVLRNVPQIGTQLLGDVREESGAAERLVARLGGGRRSSRRRQDRRGQYFGERPPSTAPFLSGHGGGDVRAAVLRTATTSHMRWQQFSMMTTAAV